MSWEKVKLRDLLWIRNGKDHKHLNEGIYPVYGSGGVLRYVDKYLYDKKSVLLPRKGSLNNIQYAEVPFWSVDTCYYTEIFEDKVVPYFLFSALRKYDVAALNTGAAVPSMTFEKYYNIDVEIPNLETQRAISYILSRYDNLISNYRKQIKLLEEAAQRLYKEWFVDMRFPGHETAKFNEDGLPEGWEYQQLQDIANIVMGQSPKSQYYNQESQGLPFHQGVGSYGDIFVKDEIYATIGLKKAEANSILFSVRAPVGRLNKTKNEIIIGRGLAAFNQKQGYQSFLFYLLKDKFYKDDILGNGSIFASITKSELFAFKIMMPTDDLVALYNANVSAIDESISRIDSQINLLTEARDRLLPKLMSGAIEV